MLDSRPGGKHPGATVKAGSLEMAKDAYWFKHESNSGRGLKMLQMAHIYTHWGKGVYWDVIEVLREQDGYKYEYNEHALDLLSSLVNVSDKIRFSNWVKDCCRIGLFEEDGKHFFSPVLIKNMVNWETKKSNGSQGGRPKKNPNKSESKPKHKPKQKDKRREEKNILIPSLEEFLENAKIELGDRYLSLKLSVEYKYKAWKESGWCVNRKGKPEPIKNWKTTFFNTIQYLKPVHSESTGQIATEY